MSTWISKFRALGLILPLAGCMGEGTGDGLGFLSTPEPAEKAAPVLREVSLFRGNVVVAGPRGYCVDPDSLQRSAGGAFVLIASCETLSGQAGIGVEPAVMTVSVLPRRIGAEQPLSADLAASSASARVLFSDDGDGVSLLQLADGGDGLLPEGDTKYWRAGMLINGHVVGLGLYGPKNGTVTGADGRALLMALAETLRERSPVQDYTPVSQAAAGDIEKKPTGLGMLLGELFPESN